MALGFVGNGLASIVGVFGHNAAAQSEWLAAEVTGCYCVGDMGRYPTTSTTDYCNNYSQKTYGLSAAKTDGGDGIARVTSAVVATVVANTMPRGTSSSSTSCSRNDGTTKVTANIDNATSTTEVVLPSNRRSRLGDILSAVVSSTSQALSATSANRRANSQNTISSSSSNAAIIIVTDTGASNDGTPSPAGGCTISGNSSNSSHGDRIGTTTPMPGVLWYSGAGSGAVGGGTLTPMPASMWSIGGGGGGGGGTAAGSGGYNSMQQLSTSWEYLR